MYRRARKPNYTHEETMALLEQITFHKHILFGKSTNHQRAELWAMIADIVNAVPGGAGRTVEELKHRWKDLSHRTRIAARNLQQENVKSDSAVAAPSLYFDIIMKIVGESVKDCKKVRNPVSSECQNSVSRFTEDSMDVKPDISQMNGCLSIEGNSNGDRQYGSASVEVPTDIGRRRLEKISRNPGNSLLPKQICLNFHGTNSDQTPVSICKNGQSQSVDLSKKRRRRKSVPRGLRQLATTYSVGKTFTSSWPPTQVPISRPMRLDLNTQEVLEMDEHDPHSDSSENKSVSPRSEIPASNMKVAAGKPETQADEKQSMKASPGLEAATVHNEETRNAEYSSLMSLSLQDLQKLYYIKKIQMVNQKTHYYELLQKKVECEMKVSGNRPIAGHHETNQETSISPVKMCNHVYVNKCVKKRRGVSAGLDGESHDCPEKRCREEDVRLEDVLFEENNDTVSDNENDGDDNDYT